MRLGEECGRDTIVIVISFQVGLPSGELHVYLVLGEELPIWGLVILGGVCELLLGEIYALVEGLPGWKIFFFYDLKVHLFELGHF